MDKLTQAIWIATSLHKDDVDKAGKPYILHPLRVMFLVASEPPADDLTLEEEMIAAVLHDCCEDHGDKLRLSDVNKLFGDKVMRVVDAVTRRKPEKETYRDFIYRCRVDSVATKIKQADIVDNRSRIPQLPENERGLEKRYVTAAAVLNKEGSWEEVSRQWIYKDGKLNKITFTGPNGEASEQVVFP